MLNIVADENIPQLEKYFSALGNIKRLNGRTMTAGQLAGADILLVRSVTEVNEELLAGSSIRFVGTATIGVDHLDLSYLEANSIAWANAPGCNANSVVDYVISCFCQIEGLWAQLFERSTLGIIGLGNVGSCLAARMQVLGIEVRAYDPLLPESALNTHDLSAVLACDVVSVHAPLTKAGPYPSFHMIADHELAQLKPGAVLISAGRGAVIDNVALYRFLQQRPDVTVIMDVWEGEPSISMALLPLVHLSTPHIAGYSWDGKSLGTEMIYRSCCTNLSIMQERQVADASDLLVQIPDALSDVQALCFAVNCVYDVTGDDQRFRAAMLTADDEAARAKGFDELRKFYPERREFSRYTVADSQRLSSQLRDWLAAVGFQLS